MNAPQPGTHPRSVRTLIALLAVSTLVLWLEHQAPAQQTKTEKRPLTHNDYDIWRAIQQPQLSPDGRYAAYTLAPQDGDSELIVKQVVEPGTEYRHTRGKSAGFAGLAKGPAAPEGGGSVVFTMDSKFVIFTIAPPKGAAKEEKKQAGELPRNAVGIMDVATGKVTVIPGVSSWKQPEENPKGLVYHKYAEGESAPKKDTEEEDEADFQQKGKKGGDKKGGQAAQAPKKPSDLVLHPLGEGKDIVIPDVVDYSITKDSRALVCSISTKDGEDGVFAFAYSERKGGLEKVPLALGKAKYSHFTWSDNLRYLAFFADHAAPGKDPPALSLYFWDLTTELPKGVEDGKGPPVALELLTSQMTTGLKDGMILVERGGIGFSDDGGKIYLGVAAPTPLAPTPDQEPAKEGKGAKAAKDSKDEKVVVELWHWKDDFIQPMQKVRAQQEKMRTYAAVYHIVQKRLVQLADKTMHNVVYDRNGGLAIGSDDSPYRSQVAYDANYMDYYLVDTFTGGRRPVLKKHHWGLTFSPSGRFAIFYDGKDWKTMSMPDGGIKNLTEKIVLPLASKTATKPPPALPGKFSDEDWDQPAPPPSYGVMGWTKDESNVLIYDKYDIWEVVTRGGGYRCLTGGIGREQKAQFRYVKLDPKEKHIDTTKPMLLRFENVDSRLSGFAALDPTRPGGPKPLITQPYSYSNPIKAKYSDMMLLTAQSYYDFPDLWVARSTMKELVQISNANPQKNDFIWGKAELINYKNADGVPLRGILIKPENFDPKKKYPMLVYIYEKLSQNLNHFVLPNAGTSINSSFYASNGYFVFMPDIVYTPGYPGQSALKCVLPGIQAVVDGGNVNEDAIGIQGHSWGGYQIAYMITQTGRFKAAAAGAPVSNMTSAYDGIRWGTGLPRQFQYEKTQSRIGGTLWDYPMRFVENSPVFMADRVKTPLLMLHNDQDDAVPWYQGIEYYLALRRLGKEVYLFNYPGEFHSLRKKVNQKDYTLRMQQFFDHYLKGAPAPAWMQNGIPYEPRGPVVGPAMKAGDD
jgi:dienelactone hydrolase